MARIPAKTEALRDRLIDEAKRNPMKAGILGVLMLVLLIVVGRQALQYLAPARAGAAMPGGGASQGQAIVDQPGPTARKAAAAGPDGAKLPSTRKPLAKIQRNLFLPNPSFFPPKEEDRAKPKPIVTPVDAAAARREAQKRAVQTEAQALTLQTTIVGASPTAIINGQVLGVGGWLNGFRVVSINSGSCVVEKKGMRVTLEMLK